MEHVMLPTIFECPPAPKKNHQLQIRTDGNWEHVRIEKDDIDMPFPPTPRKNRIEMFIGTRWISVKKIKI